MLRVKLSTFRTVSKSKQSLANTIIERDCGQVQPHHILESQSLALASLFSNYVQRIGVQYQAFDFVMLGIPCFLHT